MLFFKKVCENTLNTLAYANIISLPFAIAGLWCYGAMNITLPEFVNKLDSSEEKKDSVEQFLSQQSYNN